MNIFFQFSFWFILMLCIVNILWLGVCHSDTFSVTNCIKWLSIVSSFCLHILYMCRSLLQVNLEVSFIQERAFISALALMRIQLTWLWSFTVFFQNLFCILTDSPMLKCLVYAYTLFSEKSWQMPSWLIWVQFFHTKVINSKRVLVRKTIQRVS